MSNHQNEIINEIIEEHIEENKPTPGTFVVVINGKIVAENIPYYDLDIIYNHYQVTILDSVDIRYTPINEYKNENHERFDPISALQIILMECIYAEDNDDSMNALPYICNLSLNALGADEKTEFPIRKIDARPHLSK